MSWGTTRAIVSMGTAKPMPAEAPEGLRMEVFMPISRPLESSSGPPELPGLMAASVWMTPWMGMPDQTLDLATEAADDAGGERVVEAERAADGEHLLAHREVVRAADHDRAQRRFARLDAQDGDVVAR